MKRIIKTERPKTDLTVKQKQAIEIKELKQEIEDLKQMIKSKNGIIRTLILQVKHLSSNNK